MKQNSLMPFTFKDSGETVQVRRISPFLAMQAQKSTAKPQPPMNEVDYGDGVKRQEPNPADPKYLEAVKKWEEDVERRTRKLMIERAVVVEMDDEKREQVNELRNWMIENLGAGSVEEGTSDKEFWVTMIAIASPEDLQDLMNFVTRRSQPTPEEIAAAKESFRR